MNWTIIFNYIIRSALRVKIKLLGLFILVCLLLGLYLMLEKPSYKTSWVILLPGTDRTSTISLDNLGEARSGGANAYGRVAISPKNTYKEIALSDAVIGKAAQKYGVEATAFSKPRITLIDQTPAMQFTLKSNSSDELYKRANLYNNTFHETLDELRDNEIERNYQGIENNLAEAKQRLNQARENIVDYQNQSDILAEEQFKRWLNDAEQLRTDLTKTSVELASVGAVVNTSLSQLGLSKNQAEALLVLQSSKAIETLVTELSELLTTKAQLEVTYAGQNPVRKKNQREIDNLTQKIRHSLAPVPGLNAIPDSKLYGLLSDNVINNIDFVNNNISKFNGLKAQKLALSQRLEEYQQRIKIHTKDAAKLADLQRDHQIAEAIFSSALAKLDTSRLDIYATYPLTQLLTQPGATIKRDRLKSKLMIIAAVFVFGMLGLAIVLIDVRKSIIEEAI